MKLLFPHRKSLDNESIIVNPITEGVTNEIHLVTFQDDENPEHVLVRINGEGTDEIIDRDLEISILNETFEAKQGPKIYGRFRNGLVLEFFKGHTLSVDTMPKYAAAIARALRRFHSMDIRCMKKHSLLIDQLKSWVKTCKWRGLLQKFLLFFF